MSIQKLNSLLGDSLNRAGIRKQVDSALVLDEFFKVVRDIFRDEISEEASASLDKELKPTCLKNKILTVASLNPSLNQEIKLREKEILYRLNSRIGKDVVDKVVFVI